MTTVFPYDPVSPPPEIKNRIFTLASWGGGSGLTLGWNLGWSAREKSLPCSLKKKDSVRAIHCNFASVGSYNP